MSGDRPVFDESLKGIEQGRAAFAYKCVESVKSSLSTKEQSEYKSYVKRVPMLIKTNGLGATYAYIYSKKGSKLAYQNIYNDTKDWLINENRGLIKLSSKDDGSESELVKEIIKLESSKYRAVTIEILLLFEWLRRFAEGMLKE